MSHPDTMIGKGAQPQPEVTPDPDTPLRRGLRELIEDHRGNRTPAYAGTSDYIPIALLDELLEEV